MWGLKTCPGSLGGGSDCGDRAVASDAGGPGLKSSHQNFFIKHCLLQTVEKIKIK